MKIKSSMYCPSCGMGPHATFTQRVENLLAEQEIVREGLWHEGPRIVDELRRKTSLRDVARRSGLSPTYLSQVLHSNVIISLSAFMRLAKLNQEKPQCSGA